MNKRNAVSVRLTDREATALHELLAMILNDPGAWRDMADMPAIARVDLKVWTSRNG
jgi:hypothetical protein